MAKIFVQVVSSVSLYLLRTILLVPIVLIYLTGFNLHALLLSNSTDNIPKTISFLLLELFVLAHHCSSAFVLTFVHNITDLFITVGELIATFASKPIPGTLSDLPFTASQISYVAASQASVLSLIAVFRLASLMVLKKGQLFQVFVLCPDEERNKWAQFFGRRLWYKQSLKGETATVRALRSVSACLLALGLVVFSFYSIIYQPVFDGNESTLLKLAMINSEDYVNSVGSHSLDTVHLIIYRFPNNNDHSDFNGNIAHYTLYKVDVHQNCSNGQGENSTNWYSDWQAVNCDNWEISNITLSSETVLRYQCPPCGGLWPLSETLISIDYSEAWSQLKPEDRIYFRARVRLADSLAPEKNSGLNYSRPAYLRPSQNLVGFASSHIWQSMTPSIWNKLGSGTSSVDTYLVGEVIDLVTDPTMSLNPNVSTLRIYMSEKAYLADHA